MTVTCLDHVQELFSNPLSFPRHRQSLEEWQALIRTARKHHEVVILVVLKEERYAYETRVKIEEDDGEPIERQMIQLWFVHRAQLDAAARFCSDWLLVIDGTFNTSKDCLPLLITIGVLNSGKIFPVCFSYCPSESAESFAFVWDSLKEECFKPDGNLPAPPFPRIFLGDQAGGLLSSVSKAFSDALVQSCDWHAVEAMAPIECHNSSDYIAYPE
jgi:hypothetical protein